MYGEELMRFIAIFVSLFGGVILVWGLDLPPVIAGQYLMLGFGLLMGGLFLYVYANKNKNK